MQNIPGDINIKTISLFTSKGKVDILEHVQVMSIYESIFTPGIIAELAVWDTENISALLPILGAERLYIEMSTPGRKESKYDLKLVGMKESEPADNMRSKVYTLNAASPEVLTNQTLNVTKAYNTNISNMIEDIVKTYLKTNKKVDVQKTKGIQKILVQSKKPFDSITMLRKRSISSDDKSSSYVFFENQQGFHFKTLEKLMSDGKPGDRVFINDPTHARDIRNSHFRNIISFENPEQFDTVKRLDRGGLAQEVRKFDFKTLKYDRKVIKFDPQEYKNADGSMKNPDSQQMKSLGKTAGYNIWVSHDSGNPDTFLSEGLGPRQSGSSILGQGNLLIHVYGDSELTAGQVIEVKMIDNSSAADLPDEHKLLSGNYLIAFIRHIIEPEGTMPRYTCSLECIKGGYKESV